MKIIRVTVSALGQAKIETRGFSGPECREASRFLEEALGQKRTETLTAEFHQTQPACQQITQSH
jgi:hypothetical protein